MAREAARQAACHYEGSRSRSPAAGSMVCPRRPRSSRARWSDSQQAGSRRSLQSLAVDWWLRCRRCCRSLARRLAVECLAGMLARSLAMQEPDSTRQGHRCRRRHAARWGRHRGWSRHSRATPQRHEARRRRRCPASAAARTRWAKARRSARQRRGSPESAPGRAAPADQQRVPRGSPPQGPVRTPGFRQAVPSRQKVLPPPARTRSRPLRLLRCSEARQA